jgi:hypothetical protein
MPILRSIDACLSHRDTLKHLATAAQKRLSPGMPANPGLTFYVDVRMGVDGERMETRT